MYYSNCLIEAIKAKLQEPKKVKFHILSPKLNYGMLHFYWVKENTVNHFLDPKKGKTIFYRISHPFFNGVYKKSSVKAFEKLIYTRMLEQCWSKEKQIKYARKHNFKNLQPIYDV